MVRKINILESILEKNEERKRYSDLLYDAIYEVIDEIVKIFPVGTKFCGGRYKVCKVQARMGAEHFLGRRFENEYEGWYVMFSKKPSIERVDDYLYGDFHAALTHANMRDWVDLANELSGILREIESHLDSENEAMKKLIETYKH